ncbi:MAG: efflux RND transporter periplasmic adaptor subunit [Desulfobacter sp.]|nr:MAG: efflux RND transporter periplasmic adaptor subunit [Desulfobacter sp.]
MGHVNSIIIRSLSSLILISGLFSMAGCRGNPEAAPPPPKALEVSVETVHPRELMLTTELPGRTSACRTAQIRPQVSGLVQSRLFKEGSNVTAGDVLYQIDPSSFKAALDNARANLKAAKRSADRARAALKAGIADKDRLQVNLDLAQTNRERYETLFEKKFISAIQRDQAVTEAKAAQSALNAALAQVESSRDAVAAAEAAIEQSHAMVETAKINLSYTTITAPISGRIGRSAVTEGAIVTAYQSMALAVIQQMDPIFVDVPQSTTELLRLRQRLNKGQLNRNGHTQNRVRLILEDGSQYPMEGTLAFQEINVDPTTGSVILRAEFPNPDHILLPGMFVRAVIKEGTSPAAILIPQQSVSRDSKGDPMTFLVDKDSKVTARRLTLDRAIHDKWLVASGLKQGDRLIVEGIQKVRPGATVKAVETTPPSQKEGDR